MKRFLPVLILILLFSACKEKGFDPLSQPGTRLLPVSGGAFEVIPDGFRIKRSAYENGGVSITGHFDLLPYDALSFTVHNSDSLEHLVLVVSLRNLDVTDTWPRRGCTENRLQVRPLETRSFTLPLPADLPHPEVDKLLDRMRNTPYATDGNFAYGADLSHISEIRFTSRWNKLDLAWEVSGIRFQPGKRGKAPGYMFRDSAAFFPFIDRYGQFKWKDWPGKIHSDEDLQKARHKEDQDLSGHPGPDDRSQFGGWKNGPRLEATGRFRVEKVDGKWWMVDPEGYLFWSNGVVRVSPSCAVTPLKGKGLAPRMFYFEDLPSSDSEESVFYHTNDPLLAPYYTARGIDSTFDFSFANIRRKYGPDYVHIYAERAHARLKSWGLNTLANSSDRAICLMDRTPYTDRLEIRSKSIPTGGSWWEVPDPFDPGFRAEIIRQLKERQAECTDPWCLGLFVDNEHRWGNDSHIARCIAQAPSDLAARKEMCRFLKELHGRPVDPMQATEEDLEAFSQRVIEKYYATIRECFDTYAPGLLYLGCRFNGHTQGDAVLQIGAKYCDVISYNLYRYTLDSFALPEDIDKPVMIGEFHFGAMDRGLFHPGEMNCSDQDDRAACYKEYMRSALRHPQIVGAHWHQFSDQPTTGRFDGQNFQVGLTDCCDTPYPETIAAFREIGYGMYPLRAGVK